MPHVQARRRGAGGTAYIRSVLLKGIARSGRRAASLPPQPLHTPGWPVAGRGWFSPSPSPPPAGEAHCRPPPPLRAPSALAPARWGRRWRAGGGARLPRAWRGPPPARRRCARASAGRPAPRAPPRRARRTRAWKARCARRRRRARRPGSRRTCRRPPCRRPA